MVERSEQCSKDFMKMQVPAALGMGTSGEAVSGRLVALSNGALYQSPPLASRQGGRPEAERSLARHASRRCQPHRQHYRNFQIHL